MAQEEFEGGHLFDLYARYVGEPQSKKDVYGYWLFIVGYLVGFAGVVLYLTEPSDGFLVREVSIALAAVGLPVGLLGIGLQLPVRQRGIQSSFLGTGIALLATVMFVAAYPQYWGSGPADYSSVVIAVYGLGVAVIGGVAALVPVVTGERSLFFEVEEDRDRDYPAVMIGEAMRGALFAVYQDGKEWTWRLIEADALAGSAEAYLSRLETEESVDRLRERVSEAGLLEIRNAAFRLYEAGEGWRWLLMRDDGSVVADSGDAFEDRDAAADSVSYLKEYGPEAPVLNIDGAAFEIVAEGDAWRWRLLDEDRSVMGESAETFDSRDDAEAATERIAAAAEDAGDLTIERYGVELFEDDDGWRWRLVDATDVDIAESAGSFDSRSAAESAVYDVLDDLVDASLVDTSRPAYEVYEDDDGWRWRLVTPDDDIVARGESAAGSADAAATGADRLQTGADAADVVRVDDAEFEYYRAADGWGWRLVTADREVIAESYATYEDRETARESVEDARTQALDADLIEFEEAAFQLYETAGKWRWRLIDEDGNVMADSGEEHETRDGAAGSMITVKEHAPDADLIEIETAAFEFFQNDDGEWNWRLVDETGQTTTQGPAYYPTKEAARESMDRLVDRAADAGARAMERSAFQVYETDDEWRWRFVHPDGMVVATSGEGYATRDEAETAIDGDVRETAAAAPIHTIAGVAVQLYETGDRWRWRLVDGDREPVAESVVSYGSRGDVETDARDIRAHAADAAVFALRAPAFQLVGGDGWQWRLVDADRSLLAVGAGSHDTQDDAAAAMDRARRLAPSAGLVDFDEIAFEVYEDAGGWRWRLIDGDERVVAAGADEYGSAGAARDAVGAVTDEVEDASILEIDTAAFELHEDDDGWRWRLIDEDGNELAASLESFPARGDAREAMTFVREYADAAPTSVAE